MSFLDNFAPGGDPTATRVILGNFEFQGFEVPESITPGATQTVIKHRLTGGKKVVDVTGVDYDPITWSGWITGGDAADRVAVLEAMRDKGKALTLTLDEYAFLVVITEFKPRFEHKYRRYYTITLEVIARKDALSAVDALTGSLDALVNSDIGKALGLAGVINVQAVTDAVTAVQTAVSEVQSIANATVDAVQTIVRPIVAAQILISSTISQVSAAVNDITTLGGLIPGNPVSKAADNVRRQAQAAIQLPILYDMQNVLGRLQKNVLAGPLASGVQTVTTGGTSLQKLAADAYGDQSKWTTIAAANGMTDPQVTGIQQVKIPASTSSA